MGKLTKYLLIGVASVVVLTALGAAAFLASFDANRYRSAIEAQALAATGRELKIGGDLDVSFFPWIAITANDVTLANRAGFGDRPMLALKSAKARVKLMPLFS